MTDTATFEGMDVEFMKRLREVARANDMKNRVGHVEPRCDCGNKLTIEDRGYRCRQCVLAERMR